MPGKPVADFSLPSTGNTTFQLSSARGSKLVLYFYPKDNTLRCTQQGSDFRDQSPHFAKAKCQMKFHFKLLSDETVCKQFDVIQLKNMYGRKVRGIVRSTFVVDEKGVLAREWRGVRVPGHSRRY
jgi:peroxiredoxin Q/BCP